MSGCPRESELFDAVRQGRWPAALDPALRAHVETCASCRELALVSSHLQDSRRQTMTTPLPPAGVLFWKAQLRKRNQAISRVTRPIVIAELLGVLLTVAALLLTGWRWLQTVDINWTSTFSGLQGANSGPWAWLAIVGALATLATFTAVAVYLLAARE